MKNRFWRFGAPLLTVLLMVLQVNAQVPRRALALSTTLENGINSPETQAAQNLGFNVNIVDSVTWGAMTTNDFKAYDLIILGDPNCIGDPGPIAPAAANTAVWSPAISGNAVVILTDPDFHSHFLTAPRTLMTSAIGFAAANPGSTGLYVSLSCYYAFTPVNTPVAALAGLGSFAVQGQGGCPENVHIVDSTSPVVAGLTDGALSGWGCSTHGGFDSWPTDRFKVVALTTDIPSSFVAPDGVSGAPYILASGGGPCSKPTVAPPADFGFLGTGWSGDVSVSSNDGLVLRNVALGPRYMANQISVPYFTLTNAALTQVRGELKPDSNDSQARSRLIDFQFNTAAFTTLQATYAIDQIPAGSNNCVVITQTYEFHDEGNDCEPTGQLRCSRWFPKISYSYTGDDALQELTIPERLYLRDENTNNDQVKLFQDSDSAFDLTHFNSPIADRLLVATEQTQQVILGGAKQHWDNYHQSFKNITEPTGFGFIHGPQPGCPECIHIHWRWGGATNVPLFGDFFVNNGSGNPIIPPGSNQDVKIAIVAFHPGEEHPVDYTDLLTAESLNGHANPVLWYAGTGHQPKDTFFLHGGFFQPKQEADLSVTVSATPTVQDFHNASYTVTIFNNGPSVATNVALRQRVSLLGTLLVAANQDCNGLALPFGSMNCNLPDIPPNTLLTLNLTEQVNEIPFPFLPLDPMVSFFDVSATQNDPTPNDNRARAVTQVTP